MSTETSKTEPIPAPPTRGFLHPGRFHYSAVELLAVLALVFLFTPFIEELPNGELLEAVLMTGVMVSSVLTVGDRRRTLVISGNQPTRNSHDLASNT